MVALWLMLAGAVPALGEIRTSYLMDHDPDVHVPPAVTVFSPRLKPLWFQALDRPEADMQRKAADAMTRAHAAGMTGLEGAVPRLETVLTSATTHPAARLAAARALVELRAKSSAPSLAAIGRQFGADLRQVIEPALARWDYRPMREVWLSRLKDSQTGHRELVLAIRCLMAAGDESAIVPLLDIVRSAERSSDVRIEAARAAGSLTDHGLEAEARALTAVVKPPDNGRPENGNVSGQEKSASKLNRLCSVQLIARHTGNDAVLLLNAFAVDLEPAIAVIALARLIKIDPQLVLPLAAAAIASADVKVREQGATAYHLLPDAARVASLAGLLNDPDPGLRGSVREWLYELSRVPELDQPVRSSATAVLAADGWRGLEQAALLLAALDHQPAAQRFVELLDFHRSEVRVAAAWGAKMLAVPETLPALLTAAERRTEIRTGKDPQNSDLDVQTAHLLEVFGKMKYRPAEPLLRRHIPKNFQMGHYSRGAAIWSLGLLHEGVPDEELARQLTARINDTASSPPEAQPTRQAAALTIGRMRAVSQASALRKYIDPVYPADEFGVRVRWAVMLLTGEPIPEPASPTKGELGWFLEPLGE